MDEVERAAAAAAARGAGGDEAAGGDRGAISARRQARRAHRRRLQYGDRLTRRVRNVLATLRGLWQRRTPRPSEGWRPSGPHLDVHFDRALLQERARTTLAFTRTPPEGLFIGGGG